MNFDPEGEGDYNMPARKWSGAIQTRGGRSAHSNRPCKLQGRQVLQTD